MACVYIVIASEKREKDLNVPERTDAGVFHGIFPADALFRLSGIAA